MFGLFGKEKAKSSQINTAPDAVYLDDRHRLAAVAKELRALAARGRVTTVITPFGGHVTRIRDWLGSRGIVTATLELSYRTPIPAADEVYVVSFETLPTLLREVRAPRDFLQVERHPLRRHDEEADRLIAANSPEHRLRIRLALDDGLLTLFDADGSVVGLMKRLEIPENEAIEHALVTSAIQNAQAKIAKKVPSEVRGATFAEWRALNLPSSKM